MADSWFETLKGRGPKRIAHWEHWSCPDAETYITGIDYYEHPKQCREKMLEIYPFLDKVFFVPADDTPKEKLDFEVVSVDENGHRHVRWGDTISTGWDFGSEFTSTEQVFEYSPLAANPDLLDEDKIYKQLMQQVPAEYGDKAPDEGSAMPYWYNTMFMWPLLTFGWELFLETCLDDRFELIMDEFTEINRHVFRAAARLPVNFFLCHDDIANTRGPVCSPAWMHKYIFPRYEEFWDILKSGGKQVVFMSDGNVNAFVDDIMACGASGIIAEPSTDYKTIARKYENCFIAGEGDNRVLSRNNQDEIKSMVLDMVETANMSGGYMMCIGNQIPWNVPPEALKYYFDLSRELGYRTSRG